MDTDFVVVTLNLWRMRGEWPKRRELVLRELERFDPDIVALQEVAPFRCQAQALARDLSRRSGRRYRAFVARKRGWRGLLEGIAVITRLPARATTRRIGGVRVAQAVRVLLPSGEMVTTFNTHLEAGGEARELRLQQVGTLLSWAECEQRPVLLTGDFNAQPGSRTVARIEQAGFASAYGSAHGAEPRWTAPAAAEGPDGNVLDYIFVDAPLRVVSCDLAFDEPDADGRYASDHFGLVARLRTRSQTTAVSSLVQ